MRSFDILKASLAYAAIVFCVGFALGVIRILVVVPRIGVRWAELGEAPLMVFASFVAARVISHRFGPFGRAQCAALGLFALAVMVLAEIGLVLAQGLRIPEYIASRDPVSGAAYLLALALFAAMPLLVRVRRRCQA